MPRPPDSDLLIAQVSMRGVVPGAGGIGKNANFIYYFRRTSGVAPIAELPIATAFQTAIGSLVLAALNIRYQQTSNVVRMIDDAQRQEVSQPQAGTGVITGDSMPLENSVFTLFRSAVRGKSFKGGKHYFPLSESDTSTATADILNTAAQGRFNAINAAVLAGFSDSNGNVWVPCVYSKILSQDKINFTTIVTSDVTQCLLNQRVSSQKKHKIASVY